MKKNNKSIINNVILNGLKTLLSILFPLITYPYVTRVLHATNLGKVNFAQSIVSYFALIAALGVSTYAVREGAKIKSDREKLGVFCNEVFTVNLVTTVFTYVLLALALFLIPKLREYTTLISIFSISIIATTVGIDWLNVIFEDFFIITVRSIFVQIVNLVLLFCLVKSEDHYYRYALLLVLSNIIICIWNFIYCRKYLNIRLTKKPHLLKHIKPLLVFFASNLAISVYCYIDTTMLGWMESDLCVGIYSVAVKAYTVVKTVLASVYTVCIPRLSNYYGKGDLASFNKLVNTVLGCLMLILLPAMTGLIVLAKPIVLFLGGGEYIEAVPTLRILSVALMFAIVGGLLSNCINIPTGKENIVLLATMVAAIVNFLLNLVMIPALKQNGAAITTVVAEFCVVAVILLKNRDIKGILKKNEWLQSVGHALCGCIITCVSYILSSIIFENVLWRCLITVSLAVSLYAGLLCLLKNRYMLFVINAVRKLLRIRT